MTPLEKAKTAYRIAENKKAHRPVLLDVSRVTLIADYFLICHGNTSIQASSIADQIHKGLQEQGIMPLHIEGRDSAHWILMDYGDLVVHVFRREDREFYNLERLWADAQVLLGEG